MKPNMNPNRPQALEDSKRICEVSAPIGDPEEVIMRLKKLEAMGVACVLMIDLTWSRENLRLFAKEAMPAFKDTPRPAKAAE